MTDELWDTIWACPECHLYERGQLSICPDHEAMFNKEFPDD